MDYHQSFLATFIFRIKVYIFILYKRIYLQLFSSFIELNCLQFHEINFELDILHNTLLSVFQLHTAIFN